MGLYDFCSRFGGQYTRGLYTSAFLYVSKFPETSYFHSQKAIATFWTVKKIGGYMIFAADLGGLYTRGLYTRLYSISLYIFEAKNGRNTQDFTTLNFKQQNG